MSADVMYPTMPSAFDPEYSGSLFNCSHSGAPCHHFCLRNSKPLQLDVEEWFMTDEVEEIEEEPEEKEKQQAGASRSSVDEERELMQTGLLDQLLDEAYAHYYEEPDEWEELADWYNTRMNWEEPWAAGNQSDEASSGAGEEEEEDEEEESQPDFHPAWRQDEAGTAPGRFSEVRSTSASTSSSSSASAAGSSSRHRRSSQPPIGTSSSSSSTGRFSSTATGASSTSHQRRSSDPDPAGGHRTRSASKRQRDWVELVEEQERDEERERVSSASEPRRRPGSNWNEPALVRELELYETFSDLFFPDPESGRL